MGLVEIEYDDVDDGFTDIAGDVLFRTAAFESQLAAIPGMFEMTVKDVNQVYDFLTGREIRLTVDGTRYWGGYLTQAEMFYATIVDTAVPGDVMVRQWSLRGVDYNILFDKRVLANYANPTSGIPKFDIGTEDGDAINYLISHFLELDADGLDYSGIENVAVINEDAKGRYGVPGEKWRQAMQRFANSTGATWYIDWDKKVINRAREDVELEWGFSDVPDGVTYFGSREIRYTKDGASIVNDALIWGGDGFSGAVSFGRVENTVSIAEGLRMQYGATHFNDTGYVTNRACRTHASVIVTGAPGTVAIVGNGPDSERGLQNAQQLLSMAWFYGMVPGPLVPGTVVTTRLFTFGAPKIITLPLRAVRITFLAPEIIRFDGQFGIQTTDPYSLWAYMKRQLLEEDEVVYVPPIPDDSTEPAPGGTFNTNVTPLPDGSTTVFTLRFPYVAASTRVTKNGLVLIRGVDYTESSPTDGEITLAVAPSESDGIYATAQAIGTGGTGPETIASIGPGSSVGAMEALMADMSYNVIELANGLYDWKSIDIPDRTGHPLTIRPASGATNTFTPDEEPDIGGVWGIWNFAYGGSGTRGYVTIDGLGYGRMVYDGFRVGKAGIFMPWGTDHVTIRNQTFRNITHSDDYEFPPGTPNLVRPWHSWCIYAKNLNTDLLIEDIWCEAPNGDATFSAFQFEDGTYNDVTVRRVHALDSYYYGGFVNGDATNLVFDEWTMTDTGSGSKSIWLAGSGTITGSYTNIHATGSDPLDDEHSGGGTFADGGGNSGI